MSLAACVRHGDDTVYCCTASPHDFSLGVRVSRLQLDTSSACEAAHTHAWCLPSPAVHVAAATWNSRPHAVVLTVDAHLWVLSLCGGELSGTPPSLLPPAYQLDNCPPPDAGCAWLRCKRVTEAHGAVDVPPRVDTDTVTWPAALLPLASCCVVAGDELVVATAHATPSVLLLTDVAATPRLGRLQLVSCDNSTGSPPSQPRCCCCVALPVTHDGPCAASGWTELSAPFTRALRLPHSSGAYIAAIGQRRPRAAVDSDGSDSLPCGCMRWVLVGNADGTVFAHVCTAGPARGCGPPVVLFHMHQPCAHIAVLAPDALLLVGEAGRVIIARMVGTANTLHMDDFSVPCAAVTGACVVPHPTRVAVACDTGVLLSSPLLGSTSPPSPAWVPILSSPHAIHGVASVTCAGGVCLLASTRDADVIRVSVPNSGTSLSAPVANGHSAPSESASQRLASALAQLQATLASRDTLAAQQQAADTALADLSGALTVAGAITSSPTCGPDGGGIRAALDARQTVASGLLCMARCLAYCSPILIASLLSPLSHAHALPALCPPTQDVMNHSSRDITRAWHLAVAMHVRPAGSAPAVWASAALPCVPAMGGTRRVVIPLPDPAPCGVPLGAGTHDVTAWLVHVEPQSGLAPTALCVLQTTIDVLHAAQPEPPGRTHGAAANGATAAASRVMRSVRMSVTEQMTPSRCLRVACGAEGSAGAWPPGDGVVRAAVPQQRDKHPGVAVRVLACRNGVAHLTLTAPSDTPVVPWVRHLPCLILDLNFTHIVPSFGRLVKRCCAAPRSTGRRRALCFQRRL